MTTENPYESWVEAFVTALSAGAAIGVAKMTHLKASSDVGEAPKALVFAPHPDDELLTGGLSLRLLRERGFAVIDVAVTLGSSVERRSGRLVRVAGRLRLHRFRVWPTPTEPVWRGSIGLTRTRSGTLGPCGRRRGRGADRRASAPRLPTTRR